MIFSHLPAGFITTFISKRLWSKGLTKKQVLWTFVIGTIAGVLPDVDNLYFYFVDSKLSHRELITHTPILYLVIFIVMYFIGRIAKSNFVRAISIVILFSTFGHLLLDSFTSGIGWIYPFSDLIFGVLSIPIFSQGFYGQHLFVFTLSIELLVFLVTFCVIVFWRVRMNMYKIIALSLSVVLLFSWTSTLYILSDNMFVRDANIYYGDFDDDGLANKNDYDVDGDGAINILDDDANGDNKDNLRNIVDTAQAMEGVWHDKTNKEYWGLFSRLGFLSNTDVVVKSYDSAGIYLSQEMEMDYRKGSSGYLYPPESHKFVNTAHNIYVFCENNDLLISSSQNVEIGDIVFYGQDQANHLALAVEKSHGDTFAVIDAGFNQKKVVKIESGEVKKMFGKTIAYGRILP